MPPGNTVSRSRAPGRVVGYAVAVSDPTAPGGNPRPHPPSASAAAWVGGAMLRATVLLCLVGLELFFGGSGIVVGVALLVGWMVLRAWRAQGAPAAEGHDAVLLSVRVNDRLVDSGVVDPSSLRTWPFVVRGVALVLFGVAVLGYGFYVLPGGFVFLGLMPIFAGLEHLVQGLAFLTPGRPPANLVVREEGGTLVVEGRAGQASLGDAHAQLRDGRVAVDALRVRRFRLPRWIVDQSTVVLPLVITAVGVLGLQVSLLLSIVAMITGGGPSAPEPSAEYLRRLLTGDTAGEESGYVTLERQKKTSDTRVDSYYLPAGSPGPITDVGGGKRVGATPRAADPRPRKAEPAASIQVEELGQTETLTPTEEVEEGIDELADPAADPEGEQTEQPQSVEVTEGWGLTDWYDTEDARREAQEIQRQLDLSRQLLRLDPDNLYGLSVKAYYEYLAMDFDSAKATYDRMIQLDGTSGAEWNNLALVYKRLGDYEKEEELYRTSLMFEPDESNTYVNLALCVAHQGRFEEALAIMKRLERELPDDPYADLHRAKIYALMGKEEESYRFLKKSLQTMRKLDTLHNIEFQQDIRVDPAFKTMRETPRFKKLLTRYYGDRPGGWWLLGDK